MTCTKIISSAQIYFGFCATQKKCNILKISPLIILGDFVQCCAPFLESYVCAKSIIGSLQNHLMLCLSTVGVLPSVSDNLLSAVSAMPSVKEDVCPSMS
jgi:hypothetical protein